MRLLTSEKGMGGNLLRNRTVLRWLLSLASFSTAILLVQQISLLTKQPYTVDDVDPTVLFGMGASLNGVVSSGVGNANNSRERIGGDDGIAVCLLIMDDNHFLIEWLAFHFYFLPLKRLIVAIDPKSRTSPKRILDRYQSRGLIEITTWNDADFFPANESLRLQHDKVKLYLARQEYFILECMREFKQENRTWVTHIDTDEFVLPNMHAHPIYRVDANRTVFSLLTHPPNDHWRGLIGKSSCLPTIRRDMGTRESETDVVQRGVPKGFNGSQFLTFRFIWSQPATTKQKPGKAFLDLSRVPLEHIHPGNTNPHRPVMNHCLAKDAFPMLIYSPFVVYHYAGTFEQFSYRDDGRSSRTMEKYKKLYFDFWYDDGAKFWLSCFVQTVGLRTAKDLLEGVGELEPWNTSNSSLFV